MPNSRQISDEQEEIYVEAPTDGFIMVIGPPGTGKTVIAFLRAQMLKRKKRAVTVVMFNKVLQRYTSNITDTSSSTLHSWAYHWWKKNKIETTDNSNNDRVYLDCPFAEKDEAKALGAKWSKSTRKWYVLKNIFDSSGDTFSKWPQTQIETQQTKNTDLPKITTFQYDWNTMLEAVLQQPLTSDWGHLIIDEAQDFPKDMFTFLRFAATQLEDGSLTILADENQRLNEEENSTIGQITSSLAIQEERCYKLEENYRSTYQIAELANHFYVGLPSGQPQLPNRQGDLPQLIKARSLDEEIDYIVRVLSNRAPGEVGVFLQTDNLRRTFFNKLQHRLGDQYRVQSYSSKENSPAQDMIFDTNGVLTILNRQSCKGLEFDFVFIPEIQSINTNGSHLDSFRMNMYVMCSRARESLFLLYSAPEKETPEIVQYLPNAETNILEYRNVN